MLAGGGNGTEGSAGIGGEEVVVCADAGAGGRDDRNGDGKEERQATSRSADVIGSLRFTIGTSGTPFCITRNG